MGLHLYFGGIGGSSLQPGNYDFRAYIGNQVIRTTCTIVPDGSQCEDATGFDGNVEDIYGYVQIDKPGNDIVEIVMMQNEGRYTGGPEELLVRVVKDEQAEWGPLAISPKYDRMTPKDERCSVIDVSHTPIILEFPPADPHADSSMGSQSGESDGMGDQDSETGGEWQDDESGESDEADEDHTDDGTHDSDSDDEDGDDEAGDNEAGDDEAGDDDES